MKRSMKLLLAAVAVLAVMCASAAFADLPETMPEDLAKLAISDGEPVDSVQMLPLADLKEIYDAISGSDIKGKTYDEVKETYMKGVDGVISRSGSSKEHNYFNVVWYAAEKERTMSGDYANVKFSFRFDKESGKYLGTSSKAGAGI